MLWYVTRAAAVSAYVLLLLAVDLGMLRSVARELSGRVSWLLDELHQFISLLAAAFVALHLLALLFDPFISFSPLNLLLPLGQPYRPLPVDLGVLALYALGVVLVSSWLRRRMSPRTWRVLHNVSFAVFFLATLHGLLAGSDAGQPWMHALYVGGAASVLFLVVARIFAQPSERAQDMPVTPRRVD
jgi:sulfoxide reductase heme-binding subunit YedZ